MDDIYRVSSSESSTVVFYVDIVLMFNNHRIRFHLIIILFSISRELYFLSILLIILSFSSWQLDDWVLCRVRQKCNSSRSIWEDQNSPCYKLGAYTKQADETCSKDTNPSIEMVRNYLYKDCPMLPYIFASPELPYTKTTLSISFQGSGDKNSCTTIHENDSSNKNNGQLLASSLESLINPFKRKPAAEGNGHHQSFVTPSKRICSREYQEEVSTSIGRDGCPMNSWGVDQSGSAENNFNADQWSSMIQYQELSQLIGFQCKWVAG